MDLISRAQSSDGTARKRGKTFGPGNPGKPFVKGQSGNPGGRSRKKPITEIYEELAEDPKFRDEIRKSIRGLVKSKRMATILTLREMAERLEGKIPDELEVRGLRDLSDEEIDQRLKALEDANSGPGSEDRKAGTPRRTRAPKART